MTERTRLVIVGGVAGGASSAARARRLSEDAEITMFERGEHISFANCGLPYYIGGIIPERERLLVQTPEAMHKRYRVDVRTRSEVVGIDREAHEVRVRDLSTREERRVDYDKLILSPGASPVLPPVPGMDSDRVFSLRNLADTDAIKQAVDSAGEGRAVIVGGGYIGLEMAEAFRNRGLDVTLVELADQVMAPVDREMAAALHQQLKLHGVDLRLGTSVKRFEEDGSGLEATLSTGETIPCALAVVAVGVRPEAGLAREAGLEIGELGGIKVDAHMQTSDPDIYAVGDVVEVTDFVFDEPTLIPLAGLANRQGRVAADNIFGHESTFGKVQGTGICKVFDLTVAMTGANEKALQEHGREYEKIYVHPASHAGYYPGAMSISLKLLFDPENGLILGSQAVGADGVDKRIDVLAAQQRAGQTVFDLAELELAYAPPYGSAKDPVNYAGFVASNVVRGDMKICHTEDIAEPAPDQIVLDVRTQQEVDAGAIPDAVHIPVDELRERLDELPGDKEVLAYCKVGLRGYLACRILEQNGFECRNFTGGWTTWQAATESMPPESGAPVEIEDDTGERGHTEPEREVEVVKEIDATAMACPGPIMRLSKALEGLDAGSAVAITATDPGFPSDVRSWCESTDHRLESLEPVDGACRAVVAPAGEVPQQFGMSENDKKVTIVVFSNDFDRVMAALIIANGAATMGKDVTLFFTFWGLNVLRRKDSPSVDKNLVEKMFGAMMPRGPEQLKLSKMNMAGMGRRMIQKLMKEKGAQSLPQLLDSAREAGVRLVACTMSMDMMGIRKQEMIEGVEEGGVAMYLGEAQGGNVNLFI